MKALTIVKIGGKLLDDPASRAGVLGYFANIKGPKILVHGGGKKSSELSHSLGIPPQIVAGRRITDTETLPIVVMVYAGLLNKTVVSQLQSIGCNAIGLSGADGNALLAEKRNTKPVDFGWVGDIIKVSTAFIHRLLEDGLTPVFCAITHNGKGQLLNTNADTIATALASALTEAYKVTLKFCFEKNGVLLDPENDGSVLTALTKTDYHHYKKQGLISAGMIPKLDNAFAAKRAKVSTVYVCGREGIAADASIKGTEICL